MILSQEREGIVLLCSRMAPMMSSTTAVLWERSNLRPGTHILQLKLVTLKCQTSLNQVCIYFELFDLLSINNISVVYEQARCKTRPSCNLLVERKVLTDVESYDDEPITEVESSEVVSHDDEPITEAESTEDTHTENLMSTSPIKHVSGKNLSQSSSEDSQSSSEDSQSSSEDPQSASEDSQLASDDSKSLSEDSRQGAYNRQIVTEKAVDEFSKQLKNNNEKIDETAESNSIRTIDDKSSELIFSTLQDQLTQIPSKNIPEFNAESQEQEEPIISTLRNSKEQIITNVDTRNDRVVKDTTSESIINSNEVDESQSTFRIPVLFDASNDDAMNSPDKYYDETDNAILKEEELDEFAPISSSFRRFIEAFINLLSNKLMATLHSSIPTFASVESDTEETSIQQTDSRDGSDYIHELGSAAEADEETEVWMKKFETFYPQQ